MERFGCRAARNVVVGRVRANLDVFGPRNLPELPDVNRPKKRLVRKGREYSAANVAGKVNHALGAIGQIAWSEDIEICPDAAYYDITRNPATEPLQA